MVLDRDALLALVIFAVSAVGLPAIASAGSVTYIRADKATLPGHRIEIDRTSEAERNCAFHAFPAVELVSAPAHGRVSTARQMTFPAFVAPNPRVKCNSHKIEGLVIYYTPDARFAGTDFVKYRIGFSDGNLREISMKIEVK